SDRSRGEQLDAKTAILRAQDRLPVKTRSLCRAPVRDKCGNAVARTPRQLSQLGVKSRQVAADAYAIRWIGRDQARTGNGTGLAQGTFFERDVVCDGGSSNVRAGRGDGIGVGIGRRDGVRRARQLLVAGLRSQRLEPGGLVLRPALEG